MLYYYYIEQIISRFVFLLGIISLCSNRPVRVTGLTSPSWSYIVLITDIIPRLVKGLSGILTLITNTSSVVSHATPRVRWTTGC